MSNITPHDNFSACYELIDWQSSPMALNELHQHLREIALPNFARYGIETLGCWVPAQENVGNEIRFILRSPNRDARETAWRAIKADTEWNGIFGPGGKASGLLAGQARSMLMGLTDYSPGFEPKAIRRDRIFEFRTYVAAPSSLARLNARFRDHTMRLFERHGMKNIAYWNRLADQEGSDTTLFYLLSHRDRLAAQTSFDSFMADPDWRAALAASQVNGSLVAPPPLGVQSSFYEATDYSPVR